jgi:hypothetical protein
LFDISIFCTDKRFPFLEHTQSQVCCRHSHLVSWPCKTQRIWDVMLSQPKCWKSSFQHLAGTTVLQNISNCSPNNTVSHPTSLEFSAAHSCASLTACILNINLNHTGNRNLYQNILSDLVSVIFTDACTGYCLIEMSSVLFCCSL